MSPAPERSPASGYADIHSHVLYGLDDGARSLEESIAMLEMAAAQGTSDIVATPHANQRYRYDPETIDERLRELNARVGGVRLHRGCDFHLDATNIDDAIRSPAKYTINGSHYLLVEFPDFLVGSHDSILHHLLDADFVPIVTHPERNARVHQKPERVNEWVDMGCYIQVTAGSITGRFGSSARACAQDLLKKGLVHFVASDGHDCDRRPPTLRHAHRAVSHEWGGESARALFYDNPRAVIAGRPIPVTRLRAPGRAKWYRFWR
jgi:protein-tyrosine phosphatase